MGSGCLSCHSPVGSLMLREHSSEPPTSELPGQDPRASLSAPKCRTTNPLPPPSLCHQAQGRCSLHQTPVPCLLLACPSAFPQAPRTGACDKLSSQTAMPSSKFSTASPPALLRKTSKAQAPLLLLEPSPSQPSATLPPSAMHPAQG